MSTPADKMLYVCLHGMLACTGEYNEIIKIQGQITRKKRPNLKKLGKFHNSVDDLYQKASVLIEMFAEIERSELPKELQRRYDMVRTALNRFFSAIFRYSGFIKRTVSAYASEEEIGISDYWRQPGFDLKKLAEEQLQSDKEFRKSLDELCEDLMPAEVRLMGLE